MPARYRAEQVGSLLRPADLLQARAAYAQAKISLNELREQEDLAVIHVFERQRQIGIDILSDGEMRRGSWLTDMAEAVQGFVPQRVVLDWKGPGGGPEGSTALAAGARLKKTRKLTTFEVPFAKRHAQGPFKVTVPAPSNFLVASYKAGVTDQFYPTYDDFLNDLVEIIRDEILWLVSEGVTYVQLDAPFYSHYIDPVVRQQLEHAGLDPDIEFERGIKGDNSCLKGIPRNNLTIALHVCRGNSQSRWYTEGAYDVIAEKLFGGLDVDAYLLEYDTERSGGFEPLRLVPKNKAVVLGLVTTKEPQSASQDELCRRIDQASHYVPLENLALSPQCGFASVAAGNLISNDDQWRKLELIVDTARKVWGRS
jgi:5-methyltetrahydropteroyltriglutamate--homocysteine methyltransferase